MKGWTCQVLPTYTIPVILCVAKIRRLNAITRDCIGMTASAIIRISMKIHYLCKCYRHTACICLSIGSSINCRAWIVVKYPLIPTWKR
jgi:hypothetical protein